MGCFSAGAFGVIAYLGLFSNNLERIDKDLSTTSIFALHSLMESSAGRDMLCKVSATVDINDMLSLILLSSLYR
mgnify:CR=1 FL=1